MKHGIQSQTQFHEKEICLDYEEIIVHLDTVVVTSLDSLYLS